MIYTGRRLTATEALRYGQLPVTRVSDLGLINYMEAGYNEAYDRSIQIAKQILPKVNTFLCCSMTIPRAQSALSKQRFA
jgi:hypothetical protein